MRVGTDTKVLLLATRSIGRTVNSSQVGFAEPLNLAQPELYEGKTGLKEKTALQKLRGNWLSSKWEGVVDRPRSLTIESDHLVSKHLVIVSSGRLRSVLENRLAKTRCFGQANIASDTRIK